MQRAGENLSSKRTVRRIQKVPKLMLALYKYFVDLFFGIFELNTYAYVVFEQYFYSHINPLWYDTYYAFFQWNRAKYQICKICIISYCILRNKIR
jgi:hypothetical protein